MQRRHGTGSRTRDGEPDITLPAHPIDEGRDQPGTEMEILPVREEARSRAIAGTVQGEEPETRPFELRGDEQRLEAGAREPVEINDPAARLRRTEMEVADRATRNDRDARLDITRSLGRKRVGRYNCAIPDVQRFLPEVAYVPTIVAHFDIPFVRCLDPEGRVVGDLPPVANDAEALRTLFRAMLRVRLFDTKAIALQRTGQLGTYASCLGHEALHVGIGSALRPEDVFFPTYREYGAQLWRGVRMSEILLFWGGDERGSAFAEQPHDFPWAVPIATQTLHASGAALAFRLRHEARVALAMVGDGGTSQGDFYEAINAAGVWSLPAVFVIANNRWAISVPLSKQTAAQTLAQKAVAAGLPGIQVDGNDLLAVRAVLDEAIARARRGGGPTVVEALTYRLSDHTTADDARRYRQKEEVDRAWREEPLLRFRRFLVERDLWNEQEEQRWTQRCQQEIDEAVATYLAVGQPPVTDMFDYTFAQLPIGLAEQRREALASQSHGDGSHG